MISIIIPTLNEEKFLPKLLASLANQTAKNFEVIVVDGSSKDKTVSRAKEFTRTLPHLKVIVAKNPSLPLQRNLGAKVAKGHWLAFIDADSILMPYFIDRIQAFIQEKTPLVFTTWVKPDSDVGGDIIFTLTANIFIETTMLLRRPWTPGPLTIIRKDLFERIGGYDETHAYNEDVEFGLRLKKRKIQIEVLRETLYIWSMRRMRREGKIKVLHQIAITSIPILLFERPLKYLPGYVMGGQLYKEKNSQKIRSIAAKINKQFNELWRELTE